MAIAEKSGVEKVTEKLAEKRRALGRGLESLLPGGPRAVPANDPTFAQNTRKEETSSYNPARFRGHVIYLCSKSTGAVTSCTRRYFATTRTKPRESLGASVILNDACQFNRIS